MKKRYLAFLLLPGAFLLLAIGGIVIVIWFMKLRSTLTTDNPNLDRFRTRIALGTLWHFAATHRNDVTSIARALIGIVNRETEGKPAPQIGDVDLPGGPSVGPGQVYRSTAIDLGLVPPDITTEDYANKANDENWGIDAMITVFKSKLETVNYDIAKAIRLYNGSGERAIKYQGDVLAWLASTYGENPIGPPPGMA